ncbi:MAG: tRNA 2-selenouridine(34) synthase MnmH [Burkholderiaceae bacterium]|jgi:tRNA 2-selenouridine synthase|nr:tRNA 2-selenouridine(34) synthase MnmH [Burkholderiaceae bacterium]
MSVLSLSAADALARIDTFDAIIDARSEDEWALDRLPGALNWPSLTNSERAHIGTLYAQVSPFEARKAGAALTARNIAAYIEREVMDKPKNWQPLVYCWRGGQRSSALAHVLGQIGFRVHVIAGGYQAFRKAMLDDLPRRVERLQLRVLCGPTGSGKTRLLHVLRDAGAQTLDLEALACHRASVLGSVPGQPQPTQKHFEMRLWNALRALGDDRPVYVEAESKKVGNLTVPESLIAAMRAGECLSVQLSEDERVALLLEDYPYFVRDPDLFCQNLSILTALRGRAVVEGWIADVRAGRIEAVVRDLLARHYDPGYAASTRRNFARFDAARPVTLASRSPVAMTAAAQAILTESASQPAASPPNP